MASTPTQLKAGLKTALATISGLRAYDYQPDNLNTPFAWSVLDGVVYHGAMKGGLVRHDFTVTVVVGRSAVKQAQDLLDSYVAYDGAPSVRAALESDRTLGGVCQTLIVESAGNISTMDGNDSVTYLAVDWKVAVYV